MLSKALHTRFLFSNAFSILSSNSLGLLAVKKFFLKSTVLDEGFFVQLRVSLICYEQNQFFRLCIRREVDL